MQDSAYNPDAWLPRKQVTLYQFPLVTAFATTIHRAQGRREDQIVIELGRCRRLTTWPLSILGEVHDVVIRIEFQDRGYPHAHMISWAKNSPNVGAGDWDAHCVFRARQCARSSVRRLVVVCLLLEREAQRQDRRSSSEQDLEEMLETVTTTLGAIVLESMGKQENPTKRSQKSRAGKKLGRKLVKRGRKLKNWCKPCSNQGAKTTNDRC